MSDQPLDLWGDVLRPVTDALLAHATKERLQALRRAAAALPDTPPTVLAIIDAYIVLYEALQQL